jgi:DNA-binding NarL/FixJ family response regulator
VRLPEPNTLRTIFLVEDNLLVRDALVMMIDGEEDMRVCGAAETAMEALARIPAHRPDLVLTDLSLPGMSGMEFISRLRDLIPRPRVAVLSGHSDPYIARQAIGAGADHFVLKGDPDVMLGGIRMALVSERAPDDSLKANRL